MDSHKNQEKAYKEKSILSSTTTRRTQRPPPPFSYSAPFNFTVILQREKSQNKNTSTPNPTRITILPETPSFTTGNQCQIGLCKLQNPKRTSAGTRLPSPPPELSHRPRPSHLQRKKKEETTPNPYTGDQNPRRGYSIREGEERNNLKIPVPAGHRNKKHQSVPFTKAKTHQQTTPTFATNPEEAPSTPAEGTRRSTG